MAFRGCVALNTFGNLARSARRKINPGRRYSFGISYKVEQLCASGKKLEVDRCARACAFAAKMRQTLQIFCWLGDSVCSAKAPWQTGAIEELRIFRYSRIGASVNLIINIGACSLLSPTSRVFCFSTKTLRFSSSSLFCEGFVAWFHNIWHTMRTRGSFLSSLKTETMFTVVFIYGIKHKTEAAVGITYADNKIHHRSQDNLAEQWTKERLAKARHLTLCKRALRWS